MGDWFRRTVIDTGRLPLFCFFAAMVVGFLFIRFSTRMIRAGVRWWPGNVTPGGLHIHHSVFGIGFMLLGGIVGFALSPELAAWRAIAAAVFGVGAALVLDEFAMILRLEDVYWSQEGRESVTAVFVACAVTGLLVLGILPENLIDLIHADDQGGIAGWAAGIALAALNLSLATVTVLKGKLWTGLIGLFFPILLYVGAVRLARPRAPWARWFYHRPGDRWARRLERAQRREKRFHEPVARLGDRLSSLIAGRPS
ncbi:hypothetical protein RB614_39565 [Phytohabitans sp. ZYX-F-186]|uniref:Integral membrane protein n=1 Tax=Phytohabitans maris TaxID=3071409 RepID=A0ABU0ZXB3_9ACTN|nr:hypothetical protein [Phytohabitans sp. ZYX-F-186]MDQ7910612.1 hypothetical protein [Phytohabitans sp. ZYX-F-186]